MRCSPTGNDVLATLGRQQCSCRDNGRCGDRQFHRDPRVHTTYMRPSRAYVLGQHDHKLGETTSGPRRSLVPTVLAIAEAESVLCYRTDLFPYDGHRQHDHLLGKQPVWAGGRALISGHRLWVILDGTVAIGRDARISPLRRRFGAIVSFVWGNASPLTIPPTPVRLSAPGFGTDLGHHTTKQCTKTVGSLLGDRSIGLTDRRANDPRLARVPFLHRRRGRSDAIRSAAQGVRVPRRGRWQSTRLQPSGEFGHWVDTHIARRAGSPAL